MMETQTSHNFAQKPVRWLYVWAAIFIAYYPIIAFGYAIAKAVDKSLKSPMVWMFPLLMATTLTVLHYSRLENKHKDKDTLEYSYPEPPSQPDKTRLRKGMSLFGIFIFVVGSVTYFFTGSPPWWQIVVFTFGVPLSFVFSNTLARLSNLPTIIRKDREKT